MAKSTKTKNGKVVKFVTTKVGCKKTNTGRHEVEVEMLVGYNYSALKASDLTKVSELYHKFLTGSATELMSVIAKEGISCTPQDIADAFAGTQRGRSGLMVNLRNPRTSASWHSPHPTKFGEGIVVHNTKDTEYRLGVLIKETVLKKDSNGNKPRSPQSKNPVVRLKKVIEKLLDLQSNMIRCYKV